MRTTFCLTALLAFACASLVFCQAEVRVKNTLIAGSLVSELQQEFFGGIPFAEPPVGSLRFSPPELKLDPAVAFLNATQYGPACPQVRSGVGAGPQINDTVQSEDCLTLNVLRPAGSNSTSGLPVMVWVYGGAFQNGASSWYPADLIVLQSSSRGTPVIFVSLNYRLGPFGYPQGPEAAARGALNIGHKDVIAALQWIQENISAFGGDKNRVTVFGVSAGAIILNQLSLDPHFNLARAAIFESGSAATVALSDASTGSTAWDILTSSVPECTGVPANSSFDCLRSASTESILNATEAVYATYSGIAFSPVIDGHDGVVPALPSELYAKGQVPCVPFISGTNLDEGTFFAPPTINSTEEIRNVFYADSETLKGEIIELYPDNPALGSPFGTGNETFGLSPVFKRAAALTGDISFGALRRSLTRAASRHGTKVYSYLFSDPQVNNTLPYLGVYHGSEVSYVFGIPQNGPTSVTLAGTIIDYWVSFATSLTPNDGKGNASRPIWEEYTPSSEGLLQLHSTNLTMIPDTYRERQIDFLIRHEKNLGH